jgi:hypothetical protein
MTDILLADYGIRQLHARFVDAVWRQDSAAFADCFTDDGEWKIAGIQLKGREQIEGTIGKLLGICQRVHIVLGMPLLDIGEGTATGRIPATEFAKMKDGSSALTIGIYYDRMVEENGVWRFSWRHWGLHYRGPVDLSADLVECPDYGAFPGLPGPDEPTYTRRVQD